MAIADTVVVAVADGAEFVATADVVDELLATGGAVDSGAVAAPHPVPVIKTNPSAVRKEFIMHTLSESRWKYNLYRPYNNSVNAALNIYEPGYQKRHDGEYKEMASSPKRNAHARCDSFWLPS